jgi:hypothetical protein
MDKDTRNAIERAAQRARRALEEDFYAQLGGTFDVQASGEVADSSGAHLSAEQSFRRDKIVAAIEHKRASGMKPNAAVADFVRDAAFTTLNRFVALKLLEARDLVQECITKGEQSSGFREFSAVTRGRAFFAHLGALYIAIEVLVDPADSLILAPDARKLVAIQDFEQGLEGRASGPEQRGRIPPVK